MCVPNHNTLNHSKLQKSEGLLRLHKVKTKYMTHTTQMVEILMTE